MGLFGGSTRTSTTEQFDTGPSGFQRPYLDQAFQGAQDAYNTASGTPYYTGDRYAGMSEDALGSLDSLRNYASGAGLNTANTLSNIGANMASYAGRAGDTLDRFTTMAGENPQEANLAAAARYADNPQVQGMIDANSRDIVRNLTEQQLPGIDRTASGMGGINSSRAGVAAGIARRGAEDRIGDVSASIRGDAWNRGLEAAQSDRSTQMSALGTAASAYGNLAGMGMDAMAQGTAAGYGAYDRINAANGMEQLDRQGQLDADYNRWQGEDERQWDILNRYNSIVGGSQWGTSGNSSGTSRSRQTGGIFGQIVGALATAGSVAASDPRLKENIRKVGEMADGLGVYTYTYINSDEPQVGVMSPEVEKLRPWALGPVVSGFQTVDYALL